MTSKLQTNVLDSVNVGLSAAVIGGVRKAKDAPVHQQSTIVTGTCCHTQFSTLIQFSVSSQIQS